MVAKYIFCSFSGGVGIVEMQNSLEGMEEQFAVTFRKNRKNYEQELRKPRIIFPF